MTRNILFLSKSITCLVICRLNIVFFLPLQIIWRFLQHQLFILINKQLRSRRLDTECIIRLTTDLIAIIQSRTHLIDIAGTNHRHIIQAERTIILDMHINDRRIES